MMDDTTERTPSAEFSYHTTPSNLDTPVYTPTENQATTAPDEATTIPIDTSSLPLEIADPLQGPAEAEADGAEQPSNVDDTTVPTQLEPSDMRSDIFADISEEQSRSKTAKYMPQQEGFNLGLDPDFDLELDLAVDYKYVRYDDRVSADSDTLAVRKTESFDFVLEVDQEEVKEEQEVSEESAPSVLDRYPYFERFMDAMVEYGTVKRLNNFLHKKMAEYFKKRNMDHVLIEVQHPDEAIIKYGRKLDGFASLQEIDVVQRKELSAELLILRKVKVQQCTQVDERFRAMLEREAEIGTGLINSKTGKEISEKLVKRLIRTQATKSDELRDLRLLHITIRNAVSDKNAAIKALDKIGDNYTLIEFEQMKMENQSNMDKVEERDDELMRLRRRCQNAIQALAHMREKCSASEQNIRKLRETLHEKEVAKTEEREQMNRLKQKRDFCRLETQRLKDENGLLTKDQLLIDMENAMQAIEDLEKVNQQKIRNLARGKERLNVLKMHYENELKKRLNMGRMRRGSSLLSNEDEDLPRRHKGRRINKYMGDRASVIRPKVDCHSKQPQPLRKQRPE